jgi:hypothetical protein
LEQTLAPEDGRTTSAGGPAQIAAGLAFFYALILTAVLLAVTNRFADEPDSKTVMVWLLLPLVSAFGSWLAVLSGFAPLRAWVWLAILASVFFCWLAVFSIGPLYLPVPLLLLIAVLLPWNQTLPDEA